MIKLDNVKLGIAAPESDLIKIAEKKLRAPLKYFKILKKSLDARDKGNIFWVYSLAVSDRNEIDVKPPLEKIKNAPAVAVIGAGPAGLFCALRLIERGFAPIIIERGERVEERKNTVEKFFSKRLLNENSNVQFGEGGAGAFSDGKLNTQTKDGFNKTVIETFVKFGAPEEVGYLSKPHVGSDKLYGVLQNIRAYIINNGGKFLFDTLFCGFETADGKVKNLKLKNVKSGTETLLKVDCLVIALGHSARDTFEILAKENVCMQAKDFAVGVRIEHLAVEIAKAQYGKSYVNLPPADYKLVSHANERTVFTFCMCPGGVVMPAASEKGGVAVNGMSNFLRDGENSNSALMVQIKNSDFGGEDLFAGMRFQREIERRAFVAGGSDYRAPVQLYKDFACDRLSSSFGEIKPTYAAGTTFSLLNEVLPTVAVGALKSAIADFDRKLKGFANPYAILTGVETRFSSPVKILRDENCQSVSFENVYPCGEGSGYSGGITSSAADGIKVAEKIFEKFKILL